MTKPHEVLVQDRYDWNKTEFNNFLKDFYRIESFGFMAGAKHILSMLKEDGHEIYIITARTNGGKFQDLNLIDMAKKKLKGFKYDKIFWDKIDKAQTCLEENVDIMIDDNYHTCEEISKVGIKALCWNTPDKYKPKESENFNYVKNWGEIYRIIYQLNHEKNSKLK